VLYVDTDSILILSTPVGGMVAREGGQGVADKRGDGAYALSFAEVDRIRWQIDGLLEFPNDTRPFTQTIATDGNWVRVPDPRLLKLEPENISGPVGFRSSLHAAVRASKKHYLYRASWTGPYAQEVGDRMRVVDPSKRERAVPRGIEFGSPQLARA
jgi:hypothetical protein